MPSIHQYLSEHFYKWELRGRGWQIYDHPVKLEPPFKRFVYRPMVDSPAMDDGRSPNIFSSLFKKISQRPQPPTVPVEPEEEPEQALLLRDSLVEWQVSLPADLDIDTELLEQVFRNLNFCKEPIAFELLGTHKRVIAQFVACEADAHHVRRQLQAHFPDVQFRQTVGTLEKAWENAQGEDIYAVEFGLEQEFVLPLASGKLDPFVGIIGALAEMQPDELGLFQVQWQSAQHPWGEIMVESVTSSDDKPLFDNRPELTKAAEEKAAKAMYAVVVRIVVRVDTSERLNALVRELGGSLRAFANPEGNALIPLTNENYPFAKHIEDVLRRQSHRTGMLLNSEELTGFVHLPSSAVRSPVLQRDAGTTKAAPAIVQKKQSLYLGENEHLGEITPIYLSPDQRVRHTHIIGKSGTGKSSLLLNLIRQDIERGEGVAVLDPHGDLIDQILSIIPKHRIDDVVLVNPADIDFPVAFNILQAHSEEEKSLLASDLISVFRRLSTSWGDQMDTVLQNSILAFLESSRGGNLADLRRFLLEAPYRTEFLKTVKDPELIYYWQKVFPQLTGGKSIGPILTRLQDFFSRKPIRNMVSQPENKLDFGQMMDTSKIFLAKLSEGLLGRENSYFLGTLLIGKFQQLAMARQAQNVAVRRDFWIYIDEFFNFISPSMAQILQGTRKYRIGLTLAHHDLKQLQSDAAVASAVMTHPCTRIVFQVGDEDAKRLADTFESFEARSLKTLENFHAIARAERNDFDFNLAFPKPELPEGAEANRRKEEVIAASRSKYSTPRATVEATLLANLHVEEKKISAAKQAGQPPPKSASPLIPNVSETKAAEVPKSNEPVSNELADIDSTDSEHNGIKKQIGGEAESLNYTVTFEESVLDGKGRIDIVLRRGSQAFACEISATNTIAYEVSNSIKCLQAGYQRVAVVCRSRKKLTHIQQRLSETISKEECLKVKFYTPDEFIAKLYDFAAENPEDGIIEKGKPRKRNVAFTVSQLTESERKEREIEMLDSLKRAMKRPPKNVK